MNKQLIKSLFSKTSCDGLRVVYWDGEEEKYGPEEPRVKIIFHKEPSLGSTLDDPILYFGEAYMDGIVDFEGDLTDLLTLIEKNKSVFSNKITTRLKDAFQSMAALKKRQKENIRHHYDLGDDFYSQWLDETMSYSCAYFQTPQDSLHQAQLQKIDHILKKLQLRPGERLLDIGSGWGWLILRAAQKYSVQALGITLSENQYRTTQERIRELGLESQVKVELKDYLELDPQAYQFDKIVSVGMFEHVGKNNLPKYLAKVNQLLISGGISLLHTITGTNEHPVNSWIDKYIFPGGYIPSLRETIWLLPEYDFHLLHAESLRLHYALTLDRWYNQFSQQKDYFTKKYGQRFVRMWSLYLQGCAASFRVTGLDIHQLLFSKGLNNALPFTYDYIYSC